jgi:tetratricopeptide (TPR) repeat protein
VASSLQLVEDMTERDPLYRPGFGNAAITYLNFGMEDKVQALIDRFRSFDPTNTQLLRADAMKHFYRGDAAEGMRLAKRAYELAPTDSAIHFTYSIGLAFTLQLEKLVEEGTKGFQINALDALGRREEAYDIAYESASDGYPGGLLQLFNRSGRSKDAVDYLEERWPNLDSFAADNPYGEFGYSVMNEVALAYFNTGNTERFDDALMRVENSHAYLLEQGIDNWGLILDEARYLALAGQYEDAVARLEAAFERGMYSVTPIATSMPVFALLGDNPRLAALESAMNDKMNAERKILDLPPRDPRTEFWQYPEISL